MAVSTWKEADLCTRALLLINGDNYSAWNLRKELILIKHQREILLEEVKLTAMVLGKKPKSGETWAHRRWILDKLGDFDLSAELALSTMTAESYPKNYYSWTHRTWLLPQLDRAVLLKECQFVRDWSARHFTHYCSFHYLQNALRRCLQFVGPEDTHRFLTNEQEFIARLLEIFPDHESLWCHRRFIVHLTSLVADSSTLLEYVSKEYDSLMKAEAPQIKPSRFAYAHILWSLFFVYRSGLSPKLVSRDSIYHCFDKLSSPVNRVVSSIFFAVERVVSSAEEEL